MIKVKPAEENLSESNLDKVIKALEAEKPCTKKVACEMLGIAYNTTRLGKLIENHKNVMAHRAARRKEKLGKPATDDEVQYVISEYLTGAPTGKIAQDLYRGTTFVNNILEQCAVPVRQRSPDYFKPELIPEEAVRNEFAIGEKVWSARYDSLARVDALIQDKGEKVYRIYLLDERHKMNAYQPVSELASLEHLSKMGVKL